MRGVPQGCQLAVAANVQRQVRILGSAIHSVIERDASLCAVTGAAAAAFNAAQQQAAAGQQQSAKEAPLRRRGGLAAAIGAADPPPPEGPPASEAVTAQVSAASAASARDGRLQMRHVAEQVREATGYSLAVHSSAAWQAGRGLWLQGTAQVLLNA